MGQEKEKANTDKISFITGFGYRSTEATEKEDPRQVSEGDRPSLCREMKLSWVETLLLNIFSLLVLSRVAETELPSQSSTGVQRSFLRRRLIHVRARACHTISDVEIEWRSIGLVIHFLTMSHIRSLVTQYEQHPRILPCVS